MGTGIGFCRGKDGCLPPEGALHDQARSILSRQMLETGATASDPNSWNHGCNRA
jgi:hypothetical protein